jgi:mono/diheme cytochrome c family protein/uncharacterized membrane protein
MGHQCAHDAPAAQTLSFLTQIFLVFLSITEAIGRFHPVLVHLPIGILLVGLLLQWLSRKEKYAISADVIKIVLLCGSLTAVLSCITGFLLSGSGDYEESLVAWHMWMGIAVAAASLLLIARVVKQQYDVVHRITSFSLLMLIVLTGHLGGSLTHGSDYLTSAFLANEDSLAVIKPIANVQEAAVYEDVVKPVLQTKCYSCHSAQKQKGGLRMDDQQLLLKGGKNGEVLIAGKAAESEMIKRLLLPPNDEEHMPPKAKPQLNDRQIAILHWWIDNGADFTKKVKDLQQPEKIKAALTALETKNLLPKTPAAIPETSVEPADPKAITAVKALGAVVIPVAQGSHYLMANFVTAPKVTDDQLQLLLPLKKQLVWLKLGDTKIGDKAMAVLSQCTNLTMLHLNNTAITDEGLSPLNTLTQLQLLNLVGTKVSATGVEKLTALKKLQTLYVYATSVKPDDTSRLKKLFPQTTIETGGYSLPVLESDTTKVKASPPK